MDYKNSSTEELKQENQKIKLEVVETEHVTIYCNDDQLQTYINENLEHGDNNSKSDTSEYECDSCETIFSDELDLKDHIVQQHQDTHNGESIQSAVKAELKDNMKLYKCKYTNCGESFKTKLSLTRHASLHSDEKKAFKCKESGCTKSFKRKQHLNVHMVAHIKEKRFKCKQPGCTKSYKTKRDLDTHMILHSAKNPFKCSHDSCGKIFASSRTLNEHLRLHNGDLPFKCNHQGCIKAYTRKDQLKLHLQSHCLDSGGAEMIHCDYPNCNSKFRWNHLYKKHIRRHELGKRFPCTFYQCHAAFFEKNDLKRHIVVHTKEKFLCGYQGCPKSYARKDSLAAHQRTHEAMDSPRSRHQDEMSVEETRIPRQNIDQWENVHQCSVCEETFNEENIFEEHVKRCGKDTTFEFIKVEEIESDDSVDV